MYSSLALPIILSISSFAFALPTNQTSASNAVNSTAAQLGKDDTFIVPPEFSLSYTTGSARKLAEWPFFDAFLTAVSVYTSEPFNSRINEARRFFDADRKVRISVAPSNGQNPLMVKHAMWGLYDCALKSSKGVAGAAFKPAGCELQWAGQKIGFIRLSSGKTGDVPDPADLGSTGNSTDTGVGAESGDDDDDDDDNEQPMTQQNGTVLSARDGNNAQSNEDITTKVIATGGTDIGRTSYVLSVFEALISLAAKPYPRSENPLISFAEQSGEGTRLELKGEYVWVTIPSFYNIATGGLDQLVRALENKKSWAETTFSLSWKGTKVYNGSVRRLGQEGVASSRH